MVTYRTYAYRKYANYATGLLFNSIVDLDRTLSNVLKLDGCQKIVYKAKLLQKTKMRFDS